MSAASSVRAVMPNLHRGPGLGFELGAEYERRKQKLQEELQLDYKRHINQKGDLKVYNIPQPKGLSLPIDERTSVKEKLREERNREYNLFLQEQTKTRRFRRAEPPITSKLEEPPGINVYTYPQDHLLPTINTEHPTSRKDAATLTETTETKKGRKTWELGTQKRRPLLSIRVGSYDSSEDKFNTESEEELEFHHRRKTNGQAHKPKNKEKKKEQANRAPMKIKHAETCTDKNNNDENWNSDVLPKEDNKMMTGLSRYTTKDDTVFATGLVIGQSEEQQALQMKKEQYRQALLRQMAEQQKNKVKEKILELNVAATGATDLFKKPDSFRLFGDVHHNYEKWKHVSHKSEKVDRAVGDHLELNDRIKHIRSPRETRTASPSLGNNSSRKQRRTVSGPETGARHKAYSPDFLDEYNNNFSHMIGKVTAKGISDVPPHPPPRVDNTYKTPYDEAYYYYGNRHLLDPVLPHYQTDTTTKKDKPEVTTEYRIPPHQKQAVPKSTGPTQADFGQNIAVIPVRKRSAESAKHRREMAIVYQEELRQQIKELNENRRKEKEERDLYNAKKVAEMMCYNPWGRAGGGAPNKDQSGNLITDLDQMHRTNEQTYKNPFGKDNNLGKSSVSNDGDAPRTSAMSPVPGLRQLGFTDPKRAHHQKMYKEALKQQLEENRRKQAEERERQKMEEEKEEKRLAEQRALMQREYEEEERKAREKIQKRLDDQLWAKKNKEEPQKAKRKPEIKEENNRPPTRQETNTTHESVPSPPIPTLRQKPTKTDAPRPPSTRSQLSFKTERSESAPHSRRGKRQQDNQQELISELSALSKFLRKEQKHLEARMRRTAADDQYNPHSRLQRKNRGDTAEIRHKEKPSTQKLPSTQQVNMQNIREFNQLKYRDTSSREALLYNHPDPPTDAKSLDVQQQTLLRKQQRKLHLMKRKDMEDFLDPPGGFPIYSNKRNQHIHRDPSLPSETAFLDVYNYDENIFTQPPAEPRQRSSRHSRHNNEAVAVADQKNEPEAPPLSSDSVVKVRPRRRDKPQLETRSSDEDLSSLLSSSAVEKRRVSVDTVATEPWLRTGSAQQHLDVDDRRARRRPPELT